MAKLVGYCRVSTREQGVSGLGLEAQHEAIATYAKAGRHHLVCPPFVEVESGKHNRRPKLQDALATARRHGATLVISKLDRLSRNAKFLWEIRESGVPFKALDMPDLNTLTFSVMCGLAQHEREVISARTKAALAAAKARGVVLGAMDKLAITRVRNGSAEGVAAIQAAANSYAALHAQTLADLEAEGFISYGAQARELTRMSIPTARDKTQWSPSMVRALKLRIAALPA